MNHIIYRILVLIVFIGMLVSLFPMAQEYDWASIDEERFESFQPTEKIMDIIGVKREMTVGEVGAGGGRVAIRVAKRVGQSGKVYANDISVSALQYMRDRIKMENIPNMEVIEGTVTDPRFPKEELDVVYLTNTYRHLDKPVEILKNIKPSLKIGGKLAIIELKRYGRTEGSNEITRNAGLAGYTLIKVDKSLPRDDIYIFEHK
ncbi:MAG: class I SAM-dependent methyltransferase [Candidatus Aminicenantes bacterium]|nr:MAG: class I SAM-dependent methyltransferase [Candidatus Aminicenantes bacterium]